MSISLLQRPPNNVVLALVYYPDPRLRRVTFPMKQPIQTDRDKIEEMKRIMWMRGGVGLAAPQVGWTARLFIRNENGTIMGKTKVYINPEIISKSDDTAMATETCLSIPWTFVRVARSTEITIKALDEYGTSFEETATDWNARVIQHEFEHLSGILIVDHNAPSTP